MSNYTWQKITRDQFKLVEPMLRATVATETYYTLLADCDDEDCAEYWFGGYQCDVWILKEGNDVLGAFYLRANQRGLGSHIANAGYVVDPKTRGKGIGRMLGEKSIELAKERGFKGVQFNFVVSENTPAVHLWQSLGWRIIGTIPKAYHFKRERYVDAYVMFREIA